MIHDWIIIGLLFAIPIPWRATCGHCVPVMDARNIGLPIILNFQSFVGWVRCARVLVQGLACFVKWEFCVFGESGFWLSCELRDTHTLENGVALVAVRLLVDFLLVIWIFIIANRWLFVLISGWQPQQSPPSLDREWMEKLVKDLKHRNATDSRRQ